MFVDTPGYHRSRTKLGDYMVNVARESIADVDATILVVEPVANVGGQEEDLIAKIKASKSPAILAINKIDTVEKEELLAVIAYLLDDGTYDSIIDDILDDYDTMDDRCESAAQQTVNGTYRSVELLAVIAYILDSGSTTLV